MSIILNNKLKLVVLSCSYEIAEKKEKHHTWIEIVLFCTERGFCTEIVLHREMDFCLLPIGDMEGEVLR